LNEGQLHAEYGEGMEGGGCKGKRKEKEEVEERKTDTRGENGNPEISEKMIKRRAKRGYISGDQMVIIE
jgi:hypothetical protein